MDISVMLPKSLNDILKPKASVKLKTRAGAKSYFRLDKLLDFEWQVALGDTLMGEEEVLLFNKLDSIIESNEKVLLFTQFTEMGRLLHHFISGRYGEEPLYYHGGCTLVQRKEMVEKFQTNHADKIFLRSLKAAGTGLNLTAATHVIHYDLWWNPAVENQATDRAYRIGQRNNVMVHRFITKNTFEEKINQMIQDKKALAEMTVSSGENWIGSLSNTELREIFGW